MVAAEKHGATVTVNNEVQAISDMPNEVYHGRDEVSNSMLSDFDRSPEYYFWRYVARSIPRKPPTPAMAFGSLFHDAVLTGVKSQAVEVPEHVLSKDGRRVGAAWHEFAADNADKTLLLREEYLRLENMVDAIWDNPRAKQLLKLDDAAVEQSILWQDKETGLKLRCRPDCRRISIPFVIDLKTTADVSLRSVASSMHSFGYHRQRAFYGEGVKALTGEPHRFIFIFVEKDPPYCVQCFELDQRPDRAATKGYEEFRSGLDRLAECYRTGDWHSPNWDQVLTLDLPRWAYSGDWEVNCGDGD